MNTARPTLAILKKAESSNPDGGSIAFLRKGQAKWLKNIKSAQIFEIAKVAPFPFVIHFRIATHGGVTPELCHPFPITEKVELTVSGSAPKVLFHNGMWNDWSDVCLNVVINRNVKFLNGQLSDTRAMAWLAYHCGEEALRLLDEKIVVLDRFGMKIYGSGWTEERGIYYSNKFFDYSAPVAYDYTKTPGYSRASIGFDNDAWFHRGSFGEKDYIKTEETSIEKIKEHLEEGLWRNSTPNSQQ